MGLDASVDLGRHGRGGSAFALQGGLFAVADEQLADASDGVDMKVQGVGDGSVLPAAFGVGLVGQEQDAGVKSLFDRGVAVVRKILKTLTLFVLKWTAYRLRGRYENVPLKSAWFRYSCKQS